jgi:signal transduction histidine kinase
VSHDRLIDDLPLLLVDDEEDVLNALQRTIGFRWPVEATLGAKEALQRVETQEYAAVVSDYRMPGTDGVQFLAHVRSKWPHTERILLTAGADEEALERGINEAGVHRLMRKPWRTDVLLNVLEDAVQKSRMRREHAILLERVRNRNEELDYLNRLLADRVNRAMVGFRRRWDVALNAISDPLIIVREDLVVEGGNAAAGGLAGRPAEELEGLRCHQALFARQQPCTDCPINEGAGRITRDVGRRSQAFDARSYALPEGERVHICVYHDVTEKLAFEQEAAHVDKMAAIGRLAGGVAHELNNPLHTILTFAQLAQKPEVPAAKLERYHEIIRESAIRCRDIVQSLRTFSRRGDAVIEMRPVDLNEVCEKAAILFRASTTPQIELVRNSTRPRCLGNGNQLQQVMVNFLQNAVDASPADGRIRMTVDADNDHWLVAVEDQGPGVPAEERDTIIEPFYTTKPEGVGTGLGLAISEKILRDHDGSLRVSDSDLGGARFEARIPRMESHDD